MACCEDRPRRYLNRKASEIEDLAPLLEPQSAKNDPFEFRCRVCSQKWFEAWMPVMHSDISVVYKEGTCPDPFFDEDGRDTRQWAPPKPLSPAEERIKGDFPFLVCVVFGLVTLPAIDVLWRGLWFIGWSLAGFIIAGILPLKRPKDRR